MSKEIDLNELKEILDKVETNKNDVIDSTILSEDLRKYDKYSESYNIIFDIFSFQKLSIVFSDIDIFDSLISNNSYNEKIIIKNGFKICNVFNKKFNKKLTEFIINMWVNSLNLISMIQGNIRYVKYINESPSLVPDGELKEMEQDIKLHFYSSTIQLFDLRVRINMIIKTLLKNGESIDTLKQINIVFATYMFARLKELGC